MAEATETKMDQALAEVVAEKTAAVEADLTPVKQKAAPAKKAVVAAKRAAAPRDAKPAAKKPAIKKSVKPAAKQAAAKTTPISQIKDTIMAKTQNVAEEFTAKAKEAFTEAQDRAKAAYEKGTALFADAGEFNKGNIEALVESGKVLAAGLQTIGKDYLAEAKTAIETVQADVKELAAVKSPADFFKLQGEILRRNFDAAVCGAVSDHAAHAAHTDESDSHSEEFLTSESPRQRVTNAAFRGGLQSYA